MNIIDINEGLKNGSITLDLKGHRCNPIQEDIEDRIKDDTDWIKQLEKGSYVGHDKKVWGKEECDDMIKYLTLRLNRELTIGKLYGEGDYYCFDCGKSLKLMAVDDKTISLLSYGEFDKARSIVSDKPFDQTFRYDVAQIPECSAKQLNEEQKMVSEINVPSGELLFTNFFKEEKIYEFPEGVKKYDSEHSICGLVGRYNLMKYLATQNIGYGQMGNMSVNVFVNKAGDEIIISNDYGYDREKDREYTVKHKGFKNLGSISLSVWRWMCGDLEVLREHGEVLPDNLVMNKQTEDDYKDYILTKVIPGTWVIEHYYDFSERHDLIYSKLYLKK